ncbi:VOC family protein [Shewanella sedimentimangrovi]|uniref:VOC family protein n=1 Tax=Shewanella sedimentimangrovi TaxID=2814293 RepID=A0ABX7QY76_9GAMM|nr:VOC family protein [Shewanella sedimentimangrovi]QSX35805.1 VOC family protein [Shewanella sedimentimangrovi]
MNSPFTTPGALGWHELASRDPRQSMSFYSQVFGWQFKTIKLQDGPYHIIENHGEAIGGIAPDKGTGPARWTGYITVEDVDAVAATARSLGGKLLYGPEDIAGIGRFCWLEDPLGAVIAAISYLKD